MDIKLAGPSRSGPFAAEGATARKAPLDLQEMSGAMQAAQSTEAATAPIHVEVCQRQDSVEPRQDIQAAVEEMLQGIGRVYRDVAETSFPSEYLQRNVELVSIPDLRDQCPTTYEGVDLCTRQLRIHV